MSEIRTQLFTGLRPTGDLTLANYLGSIRPLIDLQQDSSRTLMFVADLHGLTDQEPATIAEYRYKVAADYIALGLDIDTADIYIQSAIAEPLLLGAMFLTRHMSMAELMRVPTLKDKLKDPDHPEQANVMLANYPVLMAADILMQGAVRVPVGEDQASHIEVARLLARRFNKQYGDIFIEPKGQKVKSLRIMSLTGEGKMSKSKPNGAILLNESLDSARKKIQRAETAVEGEMNPVLESHFVIAHALATEAEAAELNDIRTQHMAGQKVMGNFKSLLANQVVRFLDDYQQRRNEILSDEQMLDDVINKGNALAKSNAEQFIDRMQKATKFI